MTKISMKALLGASAAAVIGVIALGPVAHAQDQPGTMSTQPGYTTSAPPPGYVAAPPPGYVAAPPPPGTMAPEPQQNAYVPPPVTGPSTGPVIPQESNPRYPGPKLN